MKIVREHTWAVHYFGYEKKGLFCTSGHFRRSTSVSSIRADIMRSTAVTNDNDKNGTAKGVKSSDSGSNGGSGGGATMQALPTTLTSEECSACPVGRYQCYTNAANCDACPAGYTSARGRHGCEFSGKKSEVVRWVAGGHLSSKTVMVMGIQWLI